MINRKNYHYVKEYLKYREEVEQISQASLGRYWSYLRHLLLWADETLFSFTYKKRPTFTSYVSALLHPHTNDPIAWTTKKKIMESTRRFFTWLKASYPLKFKSITNHWIETLRPPRNVQYSHEHDYVSLDEVSQLVNNSSADRNLAMKRDQAAAAMLFLSGIRATAFTTLPIKSVDVVDRSIKQWPELGVKTKNRKRATTYLLPIPDLLIVVEEWDTLVRNELDPDSRWYAPIENEWGEQFLSMKAPGNNRAVALAKRIRILFNNAGLRYKSPHKFRHGHAVYGLQHADKMADYKAVSMNLMHSDIKTTDSIYAPLISDEVGKRIAGLSGGSTAQPNDEIADVVNNMTGDQLHQFLKLAAQRLPG